MRQALLAVVILLGMPLAASADDRNGSGTNGSRNTFKPNTYTTGQPPGQPSSGGSATDSSSRSNGDRRCIEMIDRKGQTAC
jgi:hypothetical protein